MITKAVIDEEDIQALIEKGCWSLLYFAQVSLCKDCGERLIWQGEVLSLCGSCGGEL